MSKVAVHVKLQAQPGKGQELLDAFESMFQGQVESEAGTLVYVLHQAKDDPDTVLFYELYADDDALNEHSSSDAMKALFPKLAGLLAGRPEMVLSRPVQAKGVAL